MFWRDFFTGIEFTAVMGIIAHILGLIIPAESLRYDSFPFYCFEWEKGGSFYNRFHISKWMARLPDMSRIIPYMFPKKLGDAPDAAHIKHYIEETCMAELVHLVLIFSSVLLPILVDGMTGVVFMLLYAFGNLPFILIQRYNRPKLVRLYRRQLKREEQSRKEICEDESADTVM